jgi:hypothetical protein
MKHCHNLRAFADCRGDAAPRHCARSAAAQDARPIRAETRATLAASKRAAGVGLMRSLPAPSVSNRLLRANNAAFDRSI